MCDTVGFIRKLPHHLIEAFKSTLEEIEYADLIIHLADASSSDCDKEMQMVNNLIDELNKNNSPVLTVFNKCDIKNPEEYLCDMNSVNISVKKEYNIDGLKNKIEEILYQSKKKIKVRIPFEKGNLIGMLYKNATVIEEETSEDGFYLTIVCDNEIYEKIKEYNYEEL